MRPGALEVELCRRPPARQVPVAGARKPPGSKWERAVRRNASVNLAGGKRRDLIFCSRASHMRSFTSPRPAALAGLVFLLPFLILNTIVGSRIEPLFSLIRPGIDTSPREYVLLFGVVFLIPAGAFLALRPMLSNRRFYALNAISAALLVFAFGALVMGIGSEIYRCDILRIPNCD
jgi:hypothetical protein